MSGDRAIAIGWQGLLMNICNEIAIHSHGSHAGTCEIEAMAAALEPPSDPAKGRGSAIIGVLPGGDRPVVGDGAGGGDRGRGPRVPRGER